MMDFNRRVQPFFMTYPGFYDRAGGDRMRDLEYLQQMYPTEVKYYQRRISNMLDKLDYDGSMIYDEYPDRFCLERLADSMMELIKREEMESNPDTRYPSEKWEVLQELVFVLLSHEIYKRRSGMRKGFLKF